MENIKKPINIIVLLKIALFCAFLSIPKISTSIEFNEDFYSSHKKSEIQSAILKLGGYQEQQTIKKGLKKIVSNSAPDAILQSSVLTFFSLATTPDTFDFSCLQYCQSPKSTSARGPPLYS